MANTNGRMSKVVVGVAIVLIATMIVGGIQLYASTYGHEVTLTRHQERLNLIEARQEAIREAIAETRADTREIKAILVRMEKDRRP